MKEFLLRYAPRWVQNLAITIYNWFLYRVRRGGRYKKLRAYYRSAELFNADEVASEQNRLLSSFLGYVVSNSRWYRGLDPSALSNFPILEKKDLVRNLSAIATIPENRAVVSLTGGTTGASMKVLYRKEDVQDRQALLDEFRSRFGYELGNRVAWFSGKKLINSADLLKGSVCRDDWINKIRFFSTFHIVDCNFDAYWSSFVKFGPEFIVGFPSSVYDLCLMAKRRGLRAPVSVKAFFPTAETVLPVHREVISSVLGCRVVDQYASSEGAPFILECEHGGKHIHSLSGVFEVVDDNGKPSSEGELLVTSFSTRGTPLVRYRIGDRIRLAPTNAVCPCGSQYPLVERIEGRATDCIVSPSNGRVNLGNISNSTKDVSGIVCFQVEQNDAFSVLVRVVADSSFDQMQVSKFKDALAQRLGHSMRIDLRLVDDIPKERSGKFRIVINNIL